MLENFDNDGFSRNLPPAELAALELEARLIAGEPHPAAPAASRPLAGWDSRSPRPAEHDISD